MASMEAELFGEVVDGMDTDKADLSDEEDAPEKAGGKDDSEASAWEEIRPPRGPESQRAPPLFTL